MTKKIIVATIVGMLLAGSIVVFADFPTNVKWGKYLAENQNKENMSDIYAVGKTATIYSKDIDKAKQYYIIAGMSEDEAINCAYQFCAEKEALYQEAIRQGYAATEAEIKEYIEELKVLAAEASNKSDVMDVIGQFESEEKYWEYLEGVYQKDLPIQKMNRQKEKDFFENMDATDEQWREYFQEWKRILVENEEFNKV